MKETYKIIPLPDDAVDVEIIIDDGYLWYLTNGYPQDNVIWVGVGSKILFTRSTATEEQQKEVESKGIKGNYAVIEKIK